LQVTSVVFFFLLMTVFVSLGYLICRILPPYNSLVRQLPAKNGYYLELESMRGILALAVVVHHAVVWYMLMYYQTSEISGPNATFYSQLGTAPVSFFFFITGFLFGRSSFRIRSRLCEASWWLAFAACYLPIWVRLR
jgi:peptidoglycan/LPS O-acetylase OafA/YrhL